MEPQRYPMSIRLSGVIHKDKCKMYMTSVLWSDKDEIVVYRSFQDFKKLHKQLKKAFMPANKIKKSDRIIPRFQYRRLKRSSQKKGTAKVLVLLKFLQKYCNELLSCDPSVSQCTELIQFFTPKGKDLQPDFAKDSIVIMHTDDEVKGSGGHGTTGNVTQPFVTETYKCVATYETKDTKNKPFKVAVNEKVDVLIKDKAGWWLVENEDKQMAWFPAPYLEKLDEDEDDDDDDGGIPERGVLYTAVKSYKATKDDEITVSTGSVVEVLQQSENGWWLIRYNGKSGYIPTIYLQPYQFPQIQMGVHHQGRRLSTPLLGNSLGASLSLEQQSQHSHSQGNLLQLPPARSPSPIQQHSNEHSRPVFSPRPPVPPAARDAAPPTNTVTSPTSHSSPISPNPPPMIRVELDGEEVQRGRIPTQNSVDSVDSFNSDSSFSDDFSDVSSSTGSFLDLSQSLNEQQLRLSRTPPPIVSNRLSPVSSPTANPEGKMIPSVSDPNLYKGPALPKVPPRPRAQEILTRCTTVTRKNAAKGAASPTQTEIISR